MYKKKFGEMSDRDGDESATSSDEVMELDIGEPKSVPIHSDII